jgi:hypothetical protein
MVQIQSKQERSMWMSALINSIPDIAIAWIASDYFVIGPIGFVGVFLGIQAVYLFLWLKQLLWSWLVYWVSSRKKMTAHLEDYLYKNRYPQPPEFIVGVDDYFMKISNDNSLPPALRVKAAIELGIMTGIKTSGRLAYLMQLAMSYENALEKYSLRFPPHDDQ